MTPDAVRTICLHGPESVGKSVLAQALAEALGAQLVPEYGRDYCEEHGTDSSMDDLLAIAKDAAGDDRGGETAQQWLGGHRYRRADDGGLGRHDAGARAIPGSMRSTTPPIFTCCSSTSICRSSTTGCGCTVACGSEPASSLCAAMSWSGAAWPGRWSAGRARRASKAPSPRSGPPWAREGSPPGRRSVRPGAQSCLFRGGERGVLHPADIVILVGDLPPDVLLVAVG